MRQTKGITMNRKTRRCIQSLSHKLTKTLGTYLHLDDPWVVDAVLATVVANLQGEEPLWLLVVNPPSTGKTELVQMFKHVKTCGFLAEVTENAFLSGRKGDSPETVPGGDRHNSLLHRWTDPNIRGVLPLVRVMLVQDLTGLITVDRKKRDAVFGQLRQIFDGRLVKATGMGEDLLWEGYLGLLGAVTPAIDEVAELNSILGERFVLYRPLRVNIEAEAMRALGRTEEGWRDTIAEKPRVRLLKPNSNCPRLRSRADSRNGYLPWLSLRPRAGRQSQEVAMTRILRASQPRKARVG